jgi:hypothetical protein
MPWTCQPSQGGHCLRRINGEYKGPNRSEPHLSTEHCCSQRDTNKFHEFFVLWSSMWNLGPSRQVTRTRSHCSERLLMLHFCLSQLDRALSPITFVVPDHLCDSDWPFMDSAKLTICTNNIVEALATHKTIHIV